MHKATKEERDRTEHLPDCAGWEDCTCFGAYVTYAEMWDQQQHVEALQDECERLRLRIAKIRSAVQKAAIAESGDYATEHELRQI